MNFIHNTDISESTLKIEDIFLDLVDFETVLNRTPDTNILIDVIGQVFELGELETVHCTGGKEKKKLEFTLRDTSLPCCLWGKYAENVYTACQEAEDDFVVKSKSQMLMIKVISSSILTLQKQKHLNKLTLLTSQSITISESGDNKLEKKLFKIHLMVKDDTGASSFMLLDSIAKGIVPQSAEYLLNGSLDELEEDAEFPDAITSLIGQTFMFGVYIEKDNATAEGVCYKVGKVWKDLNLLKIGENSESGSTHTPYEAQVPLLLHDNEANVTATTPSSKT
ncbi:hypothetical protein Rs2_35466 [Raphanus sativus]|uniref:Uncharacterized protein LOC108815679 n=1 Tax=Raphanus sativus TaxID=3726 RepID=A0A6J0K818_RAPSA|nr:uncharacterized protein LOC108815679 [Raphanus sativus]KAJ4885373.1 hypothetical protein Rs2_35466 [Raphanus sativus]